MQRNTNPPPTYARPPTPKAAFTSKDVESRAQIVLDINQEGGVCLTASCWGSPDSTFVSVSDPRLLAIEIPFALAELRLQLRLGRRLTCVESASIKKDVRQSLVELPFWLACSDEQAVTA